jgi:hypothetical protein
VVEDLRVFRHVGFFLFHAGRRQQHRVVNIRRADGLQRRNSMNVKNFNWKRVLDVCAGTLLVIGGLNWGLIGLFKVDLVASICGGLDFGETNALSRLIYSLVGLAAGYAVYYVVSLERVEKHWSIRKQETPKTTA